MQKFILIPLLFIQFSVFSQISENFSSNSFLENESIYGTKEKFIINAAEQLQLKDNNATTATFAYISTASQSIEEAVWELSVKINAATTSGNYVRYYLVADKADLSAALNGYYVMIGNTNDEICLYKQHGTASASAANRIIDGADKRIDINPVEIQIKVTRDNEGNWALYSKLPSEEEFQLEGSGNDNSVTQSSYSGIYAYYSAGNKDKYFFDDWSISGNPYTPPYQVQADEVIFNELMVKPTPIVDLPGYEYIELYNRTNEKINLSGYQLADNTKKYPIENCIIQPNSYILLCAASRINDFSAYGNCNGMSSFPNLTDDGKFLALENSQGNIISWIEYSDKWYQDSFRAGGGWSIECIDADNLSNTMENWHASINSKGGTPSAENSVKANNPDTTYPNILKTAILNDNSIEIFFSEAMNNATLTDKNNYTTELNIASVEIQQPKTQSIILFFDEILNEGNVYKITLENITDKAGNIISNNEIRFALPEEIEAADIIINEILFNTFSNGSKYVELYNRSQKTLDLSNLQLTSRRNGELMAGTLLSSEGMLLFPNEYVVLSSDIEAVCMQHNCNEKSQKIKLNPFPSYPQTTGTVVLITRNGIIIDEFSYNEKMHHVMVKNTKGVSLERINPDNFTQDSNNWHSASFESGYGTPGYINSQFSANENSQDKSVWIEPETFSPNNNGIDDMLNIHYSLEKSGYTGTITIYDANGIPVRTLANNDLLGTEGVFRWNGENNNGTLCNIGIYIIYIEMLHTNGSAKKFKLPSVLSEE